jgi:hypothetical protein
VDLALWLRCSAANKFSLAACYRDEAEREQQEAQRLDREGYWAGSDIDVRRTDDLPDNWMEIAEMPRPGGAS